MTNGQLTSNFFFNIDQHTHTQSNTCYSLLGLVNPLINVAKADNCSGFNELLSIAHRRQMSRHTGTSKDT